MKALGEGLQELGTFIAGLDPASMFVGMGFTIVGLFLMILFSPR